MRKIKGRETELERRLGHAIAARDYLVRWLDQSARALARRKIIEQRELPDGRYIVTEEWPSRAAYLETAQNRMTLEAMLKTNEDAAA
jgi:hypothetical protein